ncbi:MAG: pilus (MSHA type) biogenesis protein MshL, partial [Beggiatoa sp. IS2]
TTDKEILNNNVIMSPESGTITVRATARQHEEIQRFLNQVLGNVQRQVLIEATVAEVQLSNQYQAGIDWQRIAGDYRYTQSGSNLGISPFYSFKYSNPNSSLGSISATVNLLEQFGQVKVLSSPKIMTLNNQTAVIRVADNLVYFGTSAVPYQVVIGNTTTTTFKVTTTPKVVPVGLIMNITPQISDNDEVTLNVRPTITRVIGYVTDPNPDFANSEVGNKIPEIQVREMESILKINNGDIAIMGGLMQDTIEQNTTGIPLLSKLPLVGDLFSNRNDKYVKTELVIFLRPIVVRDASINGDLRGYKPFLPNPTPPDNLPSTGLTY